MKPIFLGACLAVLLVLLGVALVVLGPHEPSLARRDAAERNSLEAMTPTGTPEPTRERLYRSYPAPTGAAGFRKYYQKRCYPGCHSGYPVITPTAIGAKPTRERLYRSYPAPTGAAGFRKYYQKRCYPGCHESYDVSTPAPTVVHP